MKELLIVNQAAKNLGITTTPLREMENPGYILSIRTKGNHQWHFLVEKCMVKEVLI